VTVSLGPFDLIAPVGVGGMGTVWRGAHRAQGTPVAVKVLHHRADSAAFQAEFRREVGALAALHHPHVVRIFGHGTVDEAAADAEVRLDPGCPYLVMEYASGGTLHAWAKTPRPWPILRSTLLALLDALAHVHARGMVHRDLKASNVLLCTEDDLSPGLRLTDFGLAHLAHHSLDSKHTSGTPRYMAPEQFSRGLRPLGPWTDLYALGCMAWLLTTGAPLYPGADPVALGQAHLRGQHPPMRPRIDVPEGFLSWLQRLLMVSPFQRADCAAVAAFELQALGQASGIGATARPWEPDDATTVVELTTVTPLLLASLGPVRARGGVPFPAQWRRPARPVDPYLAEVGLGMFGLRTPPMVDRDTERDLLWSTLGTVVRTQRPQLVLVQGDVGTGRRRLGTWLGRRAEELGQAQLWEVRNNTRGGSAQGTGPALARHFRVAGVDRAHTAQLLEQELRAQGELDPWAWQALTEVVRPGGSVVRFDGPGARQRVLHAAFERAARVRPVVLLVDEPQADLDSLALVGEVFRAQLPVLVVATSGEGGWYPVPPTLITLRPLGAGDTAALVDALLPLEESLAEAVRSRSEGVPLFAVQWIADWVHRGLLEPGEHGWCLAPGAIMTLPDALHGLWRQRLDGVMEHPEDERLLELAAVLGTSVSHAEWTQAAQTAGLQVRPGLAEGLVERGLAHAEPEGWRFAHGLLTESLVRRATESGRVADHHRAAAAAVPTHTWRPDTFDRRARHLFGSGQHQAGMRAWLHAASAHRRHLQQPTGLARVEAVLEAADRHGLPPGDLLRLDALTLQAQYGEEGLSTVRKEQILADARAHGALGHRAFAVVLLTYEYERAGHLRIARWTAARGLSLAMQAGHLPAAVRALELLSVLAQSEGDLDGALSFLERAIALLDATDIADPNLLSVRPFLQQQYAYALMTAQRWDAAVEALDRARAACDLTGDHASLASIEQHHADVDMHHGDLASAERRLLKALALTAHPRARGMMHMDLAIPMLLQGKGGRGLELVAHAVACFADFEYPRYARCAWWTMVYAAACVADWGLWTDHLTRAQKSRGADTHLEHTLGERAERAGNAAVQAGRHDLAIEALEFAQRNFDHLPELSRHSERVAASLQRARRRSAAEPALSFTAVDDCAAPIRTVAGEVDGRAVAVLRMTAARVGEAPARALRIRVDADHRGRGLATQLARRTLARLYEEGDKVVLAEGDPAFWMRLGFRPVEDADITGLDGPWTVLHLTEGLPPAGRGLRWVSPPARRSRRS
jgi:eukaryotic-like serine/threonine-protein kinase